MAMIDSIVMSKSLVNSETRLEVAKITKRVDSRTRVGPIFHYAHTCAKKSEFSILWMPQALSMKATRLYSTVTARNRGRNAFATTPRQPRSSHHVWGHVAYAFAGSASSNHNKSCPFEAAFIMICSSVIV